MWHSSGCLLPFFWYIFTCFCRYPFFLSVKTIIFLVMPLLSVNSPSRKVRLKENKLYSVLTKVFLLLFFSDFTSFFQVFMGKNLQKNQNLLLFRLVTRFSFSVIVFWDMWRQILCLYFLIFNRFLCNTTFTLTCFHWLSAFCFLIVPLYRMFGHCSVLLRNY